jgi:elongation factor 3
MGRQKLKKSYQYEIKWRGLDHKFNTWIPREDLIAKSSREGAGSRDTSAQLVRKHLEDIGLDGDIAQYNEISGLSGGQPFCLARVSSRIHSSLGQKIKLVIAACLWNNPQVRADVG